MKKPRIMILIGGYRDTPAHPRHTCRREWWSSAASYAQPVTEEHCAVSKLHQKLARRCTRHHKTPSFGGCKWNDEHVRDLVIALPSFTSLKLLDLCENQIGDAGAEALGDFLKAHFVLPHLWIDRTGKLFCDLLAVLLRVARSLNFFCKGQWLTAHGSVGPAASAWHAT